MTLTIYNTQSKQEEEFVPSETGKVKMYVCGPTVNDVPHLGHARQQVVFDVIRKYLLFSGYQVIFVSNITDIEDKILKKAKEEGVTPEALAEKNEAAHIEDYEQLNVLSPDHRPHATEYVPQMVDLIERLESNGHAYVIEGDGVYYDVSSFPEYGKLSHQRIEDLRAGARVQANDKKRHPSDFVLWKFSKPGEPEWESPWGKGRPGWHIECSAMSSSILGLPVDIHGGGCDLMFPHHEDEIAQSEGGYGEPFVRYWMHNGMVNVNNEKMSKSLGNFTTIRDVLKNHSGDVIRYFVLSNHYRKPMDFTEDLLTAADNTYTRLKNITRAIEDDGEKNELYLKRFREAMDSDINTPQVLALIWQLLRDSEAKGKYQTLARMDEVLGLRMLDHRTVEVPEEIRELAGKREAAREAKDWTEADRLRKILLNRGWSVDDTDKGPEVKKV